MCMCVASARPWSEHIKALRPSRRPRLEVGRRRAATCTCAAGQQHTKPDEPIRTISRTPALQ
eukprot:2615946-Alexandrium_andersonii.AAC.1